MKNFALGLTAVIAFTGSAIAADLPARTYSKAPPPPAAVANWTGCYVGAGGGYGFWNQNNTSYIEPPLNFPTAVFTPKQTHGGNGHFGTVQGGCDYQFGNGPWSFVLGGFGDYDFASMKGDVDLPVGVIGLRASGTEKLSSQWSVGGRIGALVFPQLLAYFVGGYTEAKFDRTDFGAYVFNIVGPDPQPAFNSYALSRTYKGWFIGAGDEYALSFLPGLFWKTEYRYSQFDNLTVPTFSTLTGARTGAFFESDLKVHTIRSELVYRFNWGSP